MRVDSGIEEGRKGSARVGSGARAQWARVGNEARAGMAGSEGEWQSWMGRVSIEVGGEAEEGTMHSTSVVCKCVKHAWQVSSQKAAGRFASLTPATRRRL
eukprot:6208585-Pleurochrysis_carterae.AAC.2